ncbi:RNA-directed DNA polymerase, eukaryota [Tanacetum coccineum]
MPSLDTKTTWDKSLPRKVNIFMWRLKLDRLLHPLNLSSRGIDISEISCPSCSGNVESNHHIFFNCVIAKEVWRIIRRWCDEAFPLFDSNSHWINWLDSWPVSREKKHCLLVIIAASLWFIWRLKCFIIHFLSSSDDYDCLDVDDAILQHLEHWKIGVVLSIQNLGYSSRRDKLKMYPARHTSASGSQSLRRQGMKVCKFLEGCKS